MPNMKALSLTVWDKKVFKGFYFGCHGNESSSWNSNLWSILKKHHPRIIYVKLHWNLMAGFREDFSSYCSQRDGYKDGPTPNNDRSQQLTQSTKCSGELKSNIIYPELFSILDQNRFCLRDWQVLYDCKQNLSTIFEMFAKCLGSC